MFSSRLPALLAPNRVSRALDAKRRAGAALIDLTETNPTTVGLPYPPDLLAPLADPEGRRYRPDPRGLASARAAVAASAATPVPPDRIVLASSTSEVYGWLFKLLCDAGTVVLVPRPSYPLFDLLTGLENVEPRPYQLEYHGVWSIDRESLTRALDDRVRAVLVVSPNNPTGSMLRESDRHWLDELCARREIAIVSDEVFSDYRLAARPDARSFLGETRALAFVLGGLSKSAGLPQVKLGWAVVNGPDALVAEALHRLELIADTYLSVSTPVQLAAPVLIERGRAIREAIRSRVTTNLAALRAAIDSFPAVTLREPEGGWSAVIEVPATISDEALALRLIEDARVVVHPGYFFELSGGTFLVLSLLPDPREFRDALDRMLPLAAGDRT
jgi:alanine-synthesizing transaminase